MASCRQIESMFQAWIDNEVGHAERVIMQQHLAECRLCSDMLQSYHRSSAALFEAYHDCRLRRSLEEDIVENLPEMNPLRITVREHNRAARIRSHWFSQYAPALATALVLLLGSLVYVTWKQSGLQEIAPVGVVTQAAGQFFLKGVSRPVQGNAIIKSRLSLGEHFETRADSNAILTLRGPTHVKLNEKTLLHVTNDRELRIDSGRAWLDVAKAPRNFKIETPAGRITVHGTVFDVNVTPDRTVVTVKSGKVEISNSASTAQLNAGEQGEMVRGSEKIRASKVDADSVTAWADEIQPNPEAYQVFARDIQMQPPEELAAEQVFVVNTVNDSRTRDITSFFLAWEGDRSVNGYCSYEVHVYNDAMQEIFKHRIDGSFFSETESPYEIKVPGKAISGVSVIHLRMIPDFTTGSSKVSFTKVTALSF